MSAEYFSLLLGGESLRLADVGASYFLPDTWSYLLPLPSAHFVLFDPVRRNLKYAEQLPPSRSTIIPMALSRTGGASEFFLANTDSGSSLLPPSPTAEWPDGHDAYFFPLRILDIPTKTLASCLDDHDVGAVHAIKLDTQGSELDIVKGLDPARLSQLLLVEMEVTLETEPVYLGAARLPEVIAYLEAAGFRFVNTRISRHSAEAAGCVGPRFASTLPAQCECDVLFVRDIFRDTYPNAQAFWSVLRRELTLLCAYYLHGEALSILRKAAAKFPIEKALVSALEQAVGQVAEHQSRCLANGALSLWHRDRT